MIIISAKIFIVAGLGLGDEGKGTTTDYLVHQHSAGLVIRYNGGPQAAHNVVEPSGRHHLFAQFGSGTLTSGVGTYLSSFMLVDPLALETENRALIDKGITDALVRTRIHRDCLVITPFHWLINQMQELARGNNRHGSCGKGIGQAAVDGQLFGELALRIGDFLEEKKLRRKLDFLWRIKIDLAEQLVSLQTENIQLQKYLKQLKNPDYAERLATAYTNFAGHGGVEIVSSDFFEKTLQTEKNIVFEGAQGVLLDEDFGFWPHVTKSKTTFANALNLLGPLASEAQKIGVLRPFTTRHGLGPFVTEDQALAQALKTDHNSFNEWQGNFRGGWFDLLTTRFAMASCGGVDSLALTNMDKLNGFRTIKVCTAYKYVGIRKDLLDTYFIWKLTANQEIKITGIKKGGHKKEELSQLLFDCQPFEFIEFEGWTENSVKSKQLQKFIDFLQSPAGLNTPISILSFGPTRADKVEI